MIAHRNHCPRSQPSTVQTATFNQLIDARSIGAQSRMASGIGTNSGWLESAFSILTTLEVRLRRVKAQAGILYIGAEVGP